MTITSSAEINIGSRAAVTAKFKDEAGDDANPTTVTIRVKKPDGTVVVKTNQELDNPGLGHWVGRFDVDQAGRWYYRVEGTGNVQAADEASFIVPPSEIV